MFKIHTISVPAAMIVSSLIIGLSIFLTVLFFFGGNGNRQKLFMSNPANQRPAAQTPTPEQLKKIQEQRAAQLKKQQESATTTTEASDTTE